MKKVILITFLVLFLGLNIFEFAFSGSLRFLSDMPMLPSSTTISVSIEDILTQEQLEQYKAALKQQEAQKEADAIKESEKLEEKEKKMDLDEGAKSEANPGKGDSDKCNDNFKHTITINNNEPDESE